MAMLLGKKIGMTQVYDDAGNLVRKLTPNLMAEQRAINYHYVFNRLARIDYPHSNDVYYYYGEPNSTENRAGRLTKVDNGTVTEEHFYGKLGEEVRNVRTISHEGSIKSYTTK